MKKNIIMILTDQMHKYAMGFLRNHITTPNLDKLAREGIVFTNAYSNNPVCGPFRGNLFTGMYTRDNGVKKNGDPLPDIECLGNTFNDNGYETSFVGKWHLGDNGNKPIPPKLRGGFKHFIGYQCYNGFYDNVCFYDEENNEHRFNYHRTDVTTDLAIKRLEFLTKKTKPFLHVIFYQAPHYPEQPLDAFYLLYKDKKMPYTANYQEVNPYTPTYSPYSPRPFENCTDYQRYGNNMQEYLKLYNAMVTQIDMGVGKIISKVHELELSDETLILFSSDHGDMQGSHGLKNKCLPYEESCGIPLIIKSPECKRGTIIKTPVSSIDFYPTCVDYANAITAKKFDGKSLIPFIEESPKTTDLNKPVFAENYSNNAQESWTMIRDQQYKLVVYKNTHKPFLMFDIDKDPFEMNNLVDKVEYSKIKYTLLEKLKAFSIS